MRPRININLNQERVQPLHHQTSTMISRTSSSYGHTLKWRVLCTKLRNPFLNVSSTKFNLNQRNYVSIRSFFFYPHHKYLQLYDSSFHYLEVFPRCTNFQHEELELHKFSEWTTCKLSKIHQKLRPSPTTNYNTFTWITSSLVTCRTRQLYHSIVLEGWDDQYISHLYFLTTCFDDQYISYICFSPHFLQNIHLYFFTTCFTHVVDTFPFDEKENVVTACAKQNVFHIPCCVFLRY